MPERDLTREALARIHAAIVEEQEQLDQEGVQDHPLAALAAIVRGLANLPESVDDSTEEAALPPDFNIQDVISVIPLEPDAIVFIGSHVLDDKKHAAVAQMLAERFQLTDGNDIVTYQEVIELIFGSNKNPYEGLTPPENRVYNFMGQLKRIIQSQAEYFTERGLRVEIQNVRSKGYRLVVTAGEPDLLIKKAQESESHWTDKEQTLQSINLFAGSEHLEPLDIDPRQFSSKIEYQTLLLLVRRCQNRAVNDQILSYVSIFNDVFGKQLASEEEDSLRHAKDIAQVQSVITKLRRLLESFADEIAGRGVEVSIQNFSNRGYRLNLKKTQ